MSDLGWVILFVAAFELAAGYLLGRAHARYRAAKAQQRAEYVAVLRTRRESVRGTTETKGASE